MRIYFSVLSKLDRIIRTSESYWKKIITLKHPVMSGKEALVQITLTDPDIVRESEKDTDVVIYYRHERKRYICVVVRHENGTGYLPWQNDL